MQKQETIRALLGITQMQMAMLLQVHPSQWSMYESGKRNLPTAAMVLLAEIVVYIQTVESKKVPQPALEISRTKSEIDALLKENEYQLQTLARKITSIEKKYQANLKALQLVSYLQTKTAMNPEIIKSIESRATKSLKKNGLQQLAILKSKELLFQTEQANLQMRLKKLS